MVFLYRRLIVLGSIIALASANLYARELPDFTALVEENSKAVVNISTSRQQSRSGRLPRGYNVPESGDSPLGDMLKHFFDERRRQAPRGGAEPASLGSGFIISSDGYILTNNHVIDKADEIIVRLSDRRQINAQLIGTDPRSDIALLKIKANNLPYVKIGRSSDLKVGEWVLAIGSPFGFDYSVTAGIVSAKGRSLPNENYTPFIQTDVAINPGNSGGPLFNLRGEVVGINSQIYSRTGGFMGLSFAIPIELSMSVVDQLKNNGRVARGWLGVVIQEVTRNLAESFGMDRAYGALITRVLPGGPAAYSDLEVGDVIIEFNGQVVDRSSALPPLVGRAPIDEVSQVTVIRNGERRVIDLKLGELFDDQANVQKSRQPVGPESVESERLKLTVGELQADDRDAMGLEEGGVRVERVISGPAKEAGVMVGDIIVSLDNRDISTVRQFKEIVDSLKRGRTVAVLVQRNQGPIFLAIELPK